MRLQRGLSLLAAVLIALAVSACGSSSSSPKSTGSSSSGTASTASSSSSTGSAGSSASSGASVDSPALRAELEQEISSTAGVKASEANKIVDCIIAKLTAAGIKTDAEAASHEGELTNFSESCAEKIVSAGG